MRTAVSILIGTSLTGCASPAPFMAKASMESGINCPAIRSAEAWINRMPGSVPTSDALVILVTFAEIERWQLQRLPTSGKDGVLELELLPGGPGHPGSAGFKIAETPLPSRIHVSCELAELTVIDEITTAN